MSARLTEMEFAELLTKRGNPLISRFCRVPSPERPKKAARGLADSESAKGQNPVSACRLIVWHGNPVPKPRQTQSDKWKKRPCVLRYREFADSLRGVAGELGDCQRLVMRVWVSFPKSYSEAERLDLQGKPHRLRPDADNFLKSIDAIFEQDCAIWDMRCQKFWDDGHGSRLELYVCCCEKGDCR